MLDEQSMIHNQLSYMDSLSRANAAGHKVDNELKEVVQQLRITTGVVEYKEVFDKAVKSEAQSIGLGIATSFLRKLQEENLITFTEAQVANDRLWEVYRKH